MYLSVYLPMSSSFVLLFVPYFFIFCFCIFSVYVFSLCIFYVCMIVSMYLPTYFFFFLSFVRSTCLCFLSFSPSPLLLLLLFFFFFLSDSQCLSEWLSFFLFLKNSFFAPYDVPGRWVWRASSNVPSLYDAVRLRTCGLKLTFSSYTCVQFTACRDLFCGACLAVRASLTWCCKALNTSVEAYIIVVHTCSFTIVGIFSIALAGEHAWRIWTRGWSLRYPRLIHNCQDLFHGACTFNMILIYNVRIWTRGCKLTLSSSHSLLVKTCFYGACNCVFILIDDVVRIWTRGQRLMLSSYLLSFTTVGTYFTAHA